MARHTTRLPSTSAGSRGSRAVTASGTSVTTGCISAGSNPEAIRHHGWPNPLDWASHTTLPAKRGSPAAPPHGAKPPPPKKAKPQQPESPPPSPQVVRSPAPLDRTPHPLPPAPTPASSRGAVVQPPLGTQVNSIGLPFGSYASPLGSGTGLGTRVTTIGPLIASFLAVRPSEMKCCNPCPGQHQHWHLDQCGLGQIWPEEQSLCICNSHGYCIYSLAVALLHLPQSRLRPRLASRCTCVHDCLNRPAAEWKAQAWKVVYVLILGKHMRQGPNTEYDGGRLAAKEATGDLFPLGLYSPLGGDG